MKLVQIKEFTNDTVTQEFAAHMAALCIWNHYSDPKYKDKGFRIANGTPKGVQGGGSTSPWKDGDEKRGYVKTATGVEIITSLEDKVRIFENGHVMANWRENDESEWDHISRHKSSGKEQPICRSIAITKMPEITQLYLDHGFFTIKENEDEKR